MCSDQSPWAVSSDLAYGFAAISVSNPSCCQCYQLTFTSGTISGKRMIVQATNTGADLSATQFDIAVRAIGTKLVIQHANTLIRYREQAMGYLTDAQNSGMLLHLFGALNMVAPLPIRVRLSPLPFSQAAPLGGTGLKAQTTQRESYTRSGIMVLVPSRLMEALVSTGRK